MEIREQAQRADHLATMHGRVEKRTTQHGVVNVALYRPLDHGFSVVRRVELSAVGDYTLNVEPGAYVLGAFVDVDHDGIYDDGEHATYAGAPARPAPVIELRAGARVEADPLTITGPIAQLENVEVHDGLNRAQRNTGRIASLDEAMFSDTSARMGLWRPVDFVEQFGGGLMLLQPYQPGKTPIVFIHGISGSARSFEHVIAALDKDRFQPWVLQYPSGVRLDVVSDYLRSALDELQRRYEFARVVIVAHSMGGLMTRSFMMKHAEARSRYAIALGVTINSPILGMKSAASGVEHSPVVVPVWRDMASDSEYVQRVNAWRWPASVPYHLFFSYLPGEASDGVVPLTSQLSLPLQAEAVRIHGFQAEHTGVLADSDFITRLLAIVSGDVQRDISVAFYR